MGGGFTRGMLENLEREMILEVFSAHVANVEYRINDGKEATVYCCAPMARAEDAVGGSKAMLAAKVYRDRRFRGFANNAQYLDASRIADRRMKKAIRNRSRVGRKAAQRLWVDREWDALRRLHGEGVSVPNPLDRAPDAVLMEFLGTDEGPAPPLAQVRLTPEEASVAWDRLIDDVEIMLRCGLVHGDLSAYNVLYHDGRPRLIDLPQAVGVDESVDVFSMFIRDLENLGGYFARQGLEVEPLEVAVRLWAAHVG